MGNKRIPKEKIQKMKEIKKNGGTIYSISKLNSFNNCNYEYYLTYIEKRKGKDNIYSYLGSAVHDSFESIYKDNANKSVMSKAIEEALDDCEMIDVKFPNDKIGESWKNDMLHFVKNFKKLDNKFETEKFFLVEMLPNVWLQGYVDATDASDKDNVTIIDWKTSSKFQKKDMLHHGRQLITYLLAEEEFGNKVEKVGWYMTKYILVKWNQPTKTKEINPKERICQRGKWVKEMSNNISKDLEEIGYDPIDIELDLDISISNNNLENLPKEIKEKYLTEDYISWYNIEEETIQETKDYIQNTVNEIESKSDVEKDWKPIEITQKNEFYCNVLCNHRTSCKHLERYRAEKELELTDEDLDDIL